MEQSGKASRPNIYLIGFMGVGKSAVGRALARALKMTYIDSDWAIEQKAGMSIAKIFEEQGEAAFRRMEQEFIDSGHEHEGMVVACGGGLPIQPGMDVRLKEKGVVICLFASPETVLKRTIGNPKRPLLNVENPEQRIRDLMEERNPIYMATGVGISAEGRTIQDVVKNIIRVYRRDTGKGGR
jgi:shikimate kinase